MAHIIIHGLGGNSNENWFLWLKNKFENVGEECIVPNMPNSEQPMLHDWLEEFSKYIKKIDNQSILIGHSLGAPFLLTAIAKFKLTPKKVILVAGFSGTLSLHPDINKVIGDIANRDFEWNELRTLTEWIILSSDNDPYITVQESNALGEKLHVPITLLHDRNHLNDRELQELWDSIQKK